MHVALLVLPYDSGHRGVRMGAGPERLLALGLRERLARAGHEVTVDAIAPDDAGFLTEVHTAFDLAARLAVRVRGAREGGRFPLVLSGNCNSSLGTVAGLRASGVSSPAVAWFDAHGDFNTPETTAGGFLDGMALATLTGGCWRELARGIPGFSPVPESNALLLGARDLDPLEAERLARSAVRHVTPAAMRGALPDDACTRAAGADALYLHVDLDVLDTAEGRANGYAAAGGPSVAELTSAIVQLAAAAPIRAAALTAYDPAVDVDGRIGAAALDLAERIVELATGAR